ncbi:MAG: GNAT family N-acetyltransferase [Sulfolobales archaeon]
MLYIRECSKECTNILSEVIGDVMEHYHTCYVNSCMTLGICSGLIAYLNDDIAGVGVYYKVGTSPLRVGVIYYIAVRVGYRGLGIGKSLIASVEELMLLNDVDVYLATTRSGNKAVRKILSELGYSEVRLDLLGRLSEIVKKLTCGYDDDLLYVKFKDMPQELMTPHVLAFLADPHNLELINRLWRSICYDVWLSCR